MLTVQFTQIYQSFMLIKMMYILIFQYFRGWALAFCPPFVHVDTEGGYIKCPHLSTQGGVKIGQCSCSMTPQYFLQSLKYNFIVLSCKKREVGKYNALHTTQNFYNKQKKISVFETNIFELVMMVKSGLVNLFWNSTSPFRVTC